MKPSTRLRVELPFTPEQISVLVGIAIHHGYTRVEPRRRWSDSEVRDAARYAMERIISTKLKEKGR